MRNASRLIGVAAVGAAFFTPVRGFASDDQSRKSANSAIDPVYLELAEKTGGHVYDMRTPEGRRAFQEDMIDHPRRASRWQRWKEIGDLSRLPDRLPISEPARFALYALLTRILH